MGTRFELVLPGEEPELLRAAGESALDEIETCHRRLTRFGGGLVEHLQRGPTATPLDAATWALFEDAITVWRASSGAFDLTLPARRMDAIVLDPEFRIVRLGVLGLPLDFGAIAKGHALDLAAAALREAGVTSAFLHGGTSSGLGIGAPPGEAEWSVVLGPWPGAPTIGLHNTAYSVSAAWAGNPHPTVDPRTGTPIPISRRVAVRGPSARLADAWSTAMLVLGERPAAMAAGWTAWPPESLTPDL